MKGGSKGIKKMSVTVILYGILIALLLTPSVGMVNGATVKAATITLSQYSGPPDTVIWVNGSGFTPNSTVYILWDNSLYDTTTSDANGDISYQMAIPHDTAGQHTIGATDTSNSASATFTIVPAIYLNPDNGYVGSTVDVNGNGFSGNVWVYIYWDSTYLGRVRSNSNGDFTYTFNVPESPYGLHTVVAIDSDSNRASASFLVLSNIVLDRYNGVYGNLINFGCTGYSANTQIYIIWDYGAPSYMLLDSGMTNDKGSYSGSFRVPQAKYGQHNVTGIDADAHSSTKGFFVNPRLILQPSTGFVGSISIVKGYGFTNNSGITVKWDNGKVLNITSTNTVGSFETNITIPYSSVGNHLVNATDNSSVNTSAVYDVTPNIVISPNHGLSGSTSTVVCTGFSASTGIKIYWDYGLPTQVTLSSGTTNSTGTYTSSVIIPSAPNGTHPITGVDNNNEIAQTYYYLGPHIILTPDYGFVGTLVTVQGMTFANNSNVNIYWDGNFVKNTTTNSTGDFVTYITVPSSQYGAHEVKAVDADGNTATAEFSVEASITLSSYHGYVFDNITIHGTGFSANSASYIYWDSTNTERSMLTDSNGEFTLTFQIPKDVAGYHSIYAEDLNGVRSNTTFFEILPSIKLSPSWGYVGSDYQVYCYGFAGNSILTLLWDNISQPYTVMSDGTGSGVIDAKVPNATVGNHNIEVYDESLNMAGPEIFTVLAVDSPTALSPSGYVNTTSPTLVWTSVDYAIEYELQYDTNSSFPSPITISHITDTQYTLTGLSDGITYYWRVCGIDSAGNKGGFSNVMSFTVDITPPSSSASVRNIYVNDPHITIYFNASDSVSGVKKVALYYSYEGGDYLYYGEVNVANGVFDFYASHGDGNYSFYTIAYDKAGNIESSPFTADCSVILDTSTPYAYIQPLPEYTTTRTFNISYVAGDNGTGVKYVDIYYSNDLSTWIYYGRFTSSPVTFVASYDGTFYFQTVAVDYAGNTENFGNAEAYTTVDTSAPEAQIVVDGTMGLNGWYVSNVKISFVTDEDAKVYYSINNGAWVEYQAGFILSDGVYNISYYAVDSAGNVGSTNYAIVKVDTHQPYLSVVSPENNEFVGGIITIQINSSDAMSNVNVNYRVDNGAWISMSGSPPLWSASLDTTTLRDGEHRIIIRTMDEAGNEAEISIKIVVDNTPPVITSVSVPTGIISGVYKVAVEAKDNGGIEDVKCVITPSTGNETYQLAWDAGDGYYEMNLNTTKFSDGTYTIKIIVEDESGKTSEMTSHFTIDNSPPSIKYTGNIVISQTGVLSFTIQDSTTGIKKAWIRIDGGEWIPLHMNNGKATYTWSTYIKDNGVHHIEVKAIDEAGNEAYFQRDVYVDNLNIAPIIYTVILIVIIIVLVFFVRRKEREEEEEVKEKREFFWRKEKKHEEEATPSKEEEMMVPENLEGGEENE